MDDFGIRSRQAGKSIAMRMMIDEALSKGKRVAVATPDQSRTSRDLIRNTTADLCEISGDMFVIPHKRK